MSRRFEVRWEGELPASAQVVWEAFTAHTTGWYWKIEYEPRAGGAERGLTSGGGTVTAWDPPGHFTTRATDADGGVNQLDYRLVAGENGTHLSFTHQGVLGEEDYDLNLDACRHHTRFYYHSLGEYVRHFAGRDAVYVSVDAPPASARDGFATLCRALGVAKDVATGDRVRLAGPTPIEGVVDYATDRFLGVRTADALHRFYGRDAWGWPVGVAHHLFAEDADEKATAHEWSTWLDDVAFRSA
jgi:hypothetical protein